MYISEALLKIGQPTKCLILSNDTQMWVQKKFRIYKMKNRGGLAARSGTEFTWSPQLRNLAEWDWVPFSFKTNMAENADMKGRWVFARFWVFPLPNSKKRFSRTFLMEFLDIRRRDVWTVHGWLHLMWFGISASSVFYKLSWIFEQTT